MKIDTLETNLGKALDSNNNLHKVDIVPLVGTLTLQQKAHHIKVFVNGYNSFNPRILAATSGASNAIIDCASI